MGKIKDWISKNHVYLTLGFSTVIGLLIAYMGFEKGVQKSQTAKNKAEIDQLKTKAENTILKEKIADNKKDIHEISQDIDDILDRK